jgi:LysR family transcriptional regulator, glycine cleavage system transcriptional activator
VKALERYLGLRLFTRSNRRVELTPAGRNYLIPVKQSLNEMEVATQHIVADPETDIVTISTAPNFLVRFLMPRLKDFQQKYPDVELQLTASNELVDLYTSNIDMAIYFGHGDWHDIDVHFLHNVYLVPVCSPELLEQGIPLEEPEDLKKHRLIHVTKRLYEWPEWLELAKIPNKGFSKGLQISSSQLATAAARESLGVALADSTLSAREIEQGKLIMPFDILLDSHRSFYLVHQKNRPLTYGMRAFKDWLISSMPQNQG